MVNMELSKEEMELLQMLLLKEENTTRIEIHHARRTFEYRDYLKSRDKELKVLLDKVNQHMMQAST